MSVLIALACRRLGHEDGALVELDAARLTLERLGATPEVERHASHIFNKLHVSSRTAATAHGPRAPVDLSPLF